MALTTTPQPVFDTMLDNRPVLPPPPQTAITPAAPWPPPYIIDNDGSPPLRRVAPYHYTYNTYCKARWRNRTIIDIFANEFRDRSRPYYEEAIKKGLIAINGQPCTSVEQVVKNGDVVSHTLHRHEPPVNAKNIGVVHEDDEMIVIDKPSGIPVHPAGRYKFNSIVEILRAERGYTFNPLPCNRLDRLTSGVMFIGKTGREAENISAKLRGRTVRKEYIARVRGRFPDGQWIEGLEKTGTIEDGYGGIVKCDEPILQVSPILGLNRARASGKSAKTLFRRIAFVPGADGREESGYSIVHCLPLTGRTHQIRVHLQFLGHPIQNDPIYSNRRVFGPNLAKGDSSAAYDDEIKARLSAMGKTEVAAGYEFDDKNKRSYTMPPHTPPPIAEDPSTLKIDNGPTQLDLARAQALHEKYGPTADYKPLHHGTLHAGSLTPPHIPHANSDSHPNSSQPIVFNSAQGDPSLNPSDLSPNSPAYLAMLKAHDEMVQDYNLRKGEKLTGEVCSICDTPLYSDPGAHELGIYLHALAYADVNCAWRYVSPMPEWTVMPGEDGTREPPKWDFEVLGEEAVFVDLEEERREGFRRNEEGERRNKESQQ